MGGTGQTGNPDDLFLIHYPIMLRKLMGEQDYLQAREDYKDTAKARAAITKTLDRLITEAGQETPALQYAYENDPAFNKRLSDQLFKSVCG